VNYQGVNCHDTEFWGLFTVIKDVTINHHTIAPVDLCTVAIRIQKRDECSQHVGLRLSDLEAPGRGFLEGPEEESVEERRIGGQSLEGIAKK